MDLNIHMIYDLLHTTRKDMSAQYDIPEHTLYCWETGVRKPPKYVMKLFEDIIINRKEH